MQQIKLNRNYKDRLFRLAFQEKKDLLDLYNAVSGRQYTNPDDLIITTLADAIYLGMKNDISFLVSDVLNLYEHQSSFNPNMPVRGLNYFADTYREYIDRNGFDIYGEKLSRSISSFTMGRKRNRIGSNFGFRMHFCVRIRRKKAASNAERP